VKRGWNLDEGSQGGRDGIWTSRGSQVECQLRDEVDAKAFCAGDGGWEGREMDGSRVLSAVRFVDQSRRIATEGMLWRATIGKSW
jgi:hypothetical protein